MPPDFLPFAVLIAIIAFSAIRVLTVSRKAGLKAYDFGRHAEIQKFAEGIWKVIVAGAIAAALVAWLAPSFETALGRPDWSRHVLLEWLAAAILVASALLIFIAQVQMGISWRVGVPAEGPGPLVERGLFQWSRNPIFVGMLGGVIGLFLWTPSLLTAAVLAATWTVMSVQIRIEEQALLEKHGAAYERYTARVRRWV